MASQSYHMVVEKIILNGRHGPYAVASSNDLGCVTFSLDSKIWQESDYPEPGTFVVLSQVRKKRAGWRAQCGRFLNPSDEQQQAEKERA